METQEKVLHTPTPWFNHQGNHIRDAKNEDTLFVIPWGTNPELTEANVAFIVLAVNSHEALLEAAKRFLACAPSNNYDLGYQEARQDIAKAISEAEGKL